MICKIRQNAYKWLFGRLLMLEMGRELVIRFQWTALIAFCFASAGLAWAFLALRSRFLPSTSYKMLAPIASLVGVIVAGGALTALFKAFTEPVWRYECFGVWRLPQSRTCHLFFLAAAALSAVAYELMHGKRRETRSSKRK
jgi:hypothetical protein